MNNSSKLPKEKGHTLTSSGTNSSLLTKLYNLPLNRKTDLIPWFSCAGLLAVLGTGVFILQGSLKNQLFDQAESRLTIKNQTINILLDGNNSIQNSDLDRFVKAFTDKQSYSAIYLYQDNGELTLASSAENIYGLINYNVALPDNTVINSAVSSNGEIVKQEETINDTKYILTAKTIADTSGKPMGVLLHGSSINSINNVITSRIDYLRFDVNRLCVVG